MRNFAQRRNGKTVSSYSYSRKIVLGSLRRRSRMSFGRVGCDAFNHQRPAFPVPINPTGTELTQSPSCLPQIRPPSYNRCNGEQTIYVCIFLQDNEQVGSVQWSRSPWWGLERAYSEYDSLSRLSSSATTLKIGDIQA